MAFLDDVLDQIASAVGPRGVDPNDANMGLPGGFRMRRPGGLMPTGALGSSTGYTGNAAPNSNVTPDDRYSPQRHAAEYPDAHQATQHLRDVNGPGAIAGTVKTGGAGTAVSSPYGAPPPTPGNEATGGAASMTPAAPVTPVTPVTPATPTAGSLLRVPQYQSPDMAKRQGLERERTALTTPTDPNAPGIRAGTGRRIAAALLGVAAGFGRNGGNPNAASDVARSIIGAKFNAAERARQGKLATVDRQISDFDTEANEEAKNFDTAVKGSQEAREVSEQNRKNQAAQNVPKGNEVLGPDGKTPGYYTESGAFRPAAPDEPKAGKESEQDKANDRTAVANKLNLKGEARTMYIATGHLPKEFAGQNGRGSIGAGLKGKDLVRWNAWTKEHGREPITESEVNEALNAKEGLKDPAKINLARAKYNTDLKKLESQAKQDAETAPDEASKQTVYQKLADDKNTRELQLATDLQNFGVNYAPKTYDAEGNWTDASGNNGGPGKKTSSANAKGGQKAVGPSVAEVDAAKKKVPAGRVAVWKDGKFQSVPVAQADAAEGQGYKVFR